MGEHMDSLRGKLLLASPTMSDPNFARSVILIAEHTEEGAMGLVLNRPAETTVADAVPDLAWLTAGEDTVFVGGPVAETAVIVLAEFDRPELAGALVDGDSASSAPTPTSRSSSAAPCGGPGCSPGTRAGGPASSRTSWPRTPGSSSRRGATRSSRRRRTTCGRPCYGARAAATPCSPRCRPTLR